MLGLGVISLLSLTKAASKSEEEGQAPLVKYKLPIFGNTIEYATDPKGFLAKCTEQYGPAFRVYAFGKVQTFIGKDSVRDVFLNDQFSFSHAIDEYFDFSIFLDGRSDVTAERSHVIISTKLTPNIKRYVPTVVPYLIQEMDRSLDVGQDSVKICARTIVEHMVTRAVMRVLVGPELCKNDELFKTYRDFTSDLGGALRRTGALLFMPVYFARMVQRVIFGISNPAAKHKRVCFKYLSPEVDRRRREMAELGDKFERPDDVLQSLIETTPEWSNKDIVMNILMIAFASIDTTSQSSSAVLAAFATYPQYIPELLQEQEEVLSAEPPNEYGTPYTSGALKKMVKLESFIREVLRCRQPNVMVLPHKNIGDDDMLLSNGVKIPKGAQVNMNWTEIHTVEEESASDPIKFNPWRSIGTNENITRGSPDFLIFGLGKHACPGRWFAASELKTIASLFLTRYTVGFGEPHPDHRWPTSNILEFSRK